MGVILYDIARPVQDDYYPVAYAKNIWFADDETLQNKFDNGLLGGGGAEIVEITRADYDLLAPADSSTLYLLTDEQTLIYNGTSYQFFVADNFYTKEETDLALAGKLDTQQDVAEAGKFLKVGDDGAIGFVEGGAGGTAESTTYTDNAHPTLTNVDAALKELFGILEYVEPKITSFSMVPTTTTYEIGASVAGPIEFAWAYNKEITSQTLTDCTIEVADRSASLTLAAPLTTNKTFTLTASDGKKEVSSSKTISFQNKVYWGSAAEATYDSAFILALASNKFATGRKGTYAMTVADAEYGYFAYPKSFGPTATVWIGGFEGTVTDCGELEFTNASGHTETYLLYRTARPGLGAISMEVKS